MRFSSQGFSLWFGTTDAPAPTNEAPAQQLPPIRVAVQPAHALNRVDIRYRVSGGSQRLLRTSLKETDSQTQTQYFGANFPQLPPGALVEYAPLLTTAGRTVDSLKDGAYPASFRVPEADFPRPPVAPEASEFPLGYRFPFRLELLFRATCKLRAELLGETPDGLRYNFFVDQGTLDGPQLRGKFLQGGDWMRVRHDGMGIPNIRVTLLLEDGTKVLMEAGGWFDFGPAGYENAKRGVFGRVGNLMTQPTFLTSDQRYAWLMRSQCFGVGAVDLTSFTLRDDVYRIVRPDA